MNILIKRFYAALILVTIIVSPLLYMPSTCSDNFSAPKKVLDFLTDIVGLNVTKYNVTLTSNRLEYRSDLAGLPEESGRYILESTESRIDVIYSFINGTLAYCFMYVLKGSPLYSQLQPANLLDTVRGILQRYQTYSGGPYLQKMISMSDAVSKIKNTAMILDNLKFTILIQENRIEFRWFYTSNGIDFINKGICIRFENGHFSGFSDGWSIYKIGSDMVNVYREDAIRIARSFAESLPWKLYKDEKQFKENASWVEVKDALVEAPLQAELLISTREPLTLYPIWRVTLYFDWLYYGNLCGVTVAIWADTGEISYYEPVFFLGGVPEESSPQSQPQEPSTQTPSEDSATPPTEPIIPEEPHPEPPPTENSNTQAGTNLTPLIIAIPTILTIILGTTLYKRKRK